MSVKNKTSPCCSGQPSIVEIKKKPYCCGQPSTVFKMLPDCDEQSNVDANCKLHFINRFVEAAAGKIPLVDTSLTFRDFSGGWKARWGINRMKFRVSPGLYGIGNPDGASPVLVTANYKLSFDNLRKELSGIDAWIMVIDTHGINVWCAAGKGTFGTAEILKRIDTVSLSRVVSHRTLILPQLGAPGVAAHEVKRQSGFKVVYGPVRARDIKEYLKAGMKAAKEMRVVEFNFFDRLILTPIEVVGILKTLTVIAAAVFIAHMAGLIAVTFSGLYPFIGAILIGAVISPAFLSWIPGHAFSLKGWIMGILWTIAVLYVKDGFSGHSDILNGLALLLLLPAISAFLTLNFTGASTYTSLSGVKKEMKFAIPAIVISASSGIVLWLASFFV
jgi:uncharacterized membrane protein